MDAQDVHLSVRHLHVGASRVTSGEHLHIADRNVARYIEFQTDEVPLQDAVEVDRSVEDGEGMDQSARDRLSGEGALLLLRDAIDE